MNETCKTCDNRITCQKAEHVENYSMRPGCSDYSRETLNMNTTLTLIRLFTEIGCCLDNRSISHLAPGEIYSTRIFEGELEEDIANLRKKYLGE